MLYAEHVVAANAQLLLTYSRDLSRHACVGTLITVHHRTHRNSVCLLSSNTTIPGALRRCHGIEVRLDHLEQALLTYGINLTRTRPIPLCTAASECLHLGPEEVEQGPWRALARDRCTIGSPWRLGWLYRCWSVIGKQRMKPASYANNPVSGFDFGQMRICAR